MFRMCRVFLALLAVTYVGDFFTRSGIYVPRQELVKEEFSIKTSGWYTSNSNPYYQGVDHGK